MFGMAVLIGINRHYVNWVCSKYILVTAVIP